MSTYKNSIDAPISAPNSDADLSGLLGYYGMVEYGDTQSIKVPRGADSMGGASGPRSIFNDYHVLYLEKGNYPVTDNNYNKLKERIKTYNALDLISHPEGASIFMPRDFMLCARYGMPINRMITLRRFPYPCNDNIFDKTSAPFPDIGRMVTYMDQEINKISEVLKFSYKLNWRELNAETQEVSGMNGDHAGVSGWMKSMAELMDDGTLSKNHVRGENLLNMNPLNDQNKVHGPVDSIATTWIRNIGMDNDMQFNITFDYELRSIMGMNPKALFIDLLSNILAVTFNNGRFWGGARIWVGGKPSNWMTKLAFFNPQSAEDFLNRGRVAFKESLAPFKQDGKQAALDLLKNIAMNGINLALGKILDKVGRPSTMVMNSLLNGDPTGEWHLTIGNPMNPIMSIGNLILENTEISFGDELGYDDFPTKMTVICTLKPGQPRDKAGLESIFNRGLGRTYWAPTDILSGGNNITLKKSDNMAETGYIKYGMETKSMKNFGSYNASDIQRSAEMSTEYIRKDAKSSELPSVSTKEALNVTGFLQTAPVSRKQNQTGSSTVKAESKKSLNTNTKPKTIENGNVYR